MATSGLFGVSIMLIFAVLGYVMASFGYSLVIFIIAFFLGPRFEKSIAQSLSLTNGDLTQVLKSPVAAALLILSLVSVIWFLRTNVKDNQG
jgi:putative tricarboxylic transport membrane protein